MPGEAVLAVLAHHQFLESRLGLRVHVGLVNARGSALSGEGRRQRGRRLDLLRLELGEVCPVCRVALPAGPDLSSNHYKSLCRIKFIK